MNEQNLPDSPVDEFKELYAMRDALVVQATDATPVTADVFELAIGTAQDKLKSLAEHDEVQAFLARVGGTAVRGVLELDELEKTGLVSEDVLESKKTELESVKQDPKVKMAIEFLAIDGLDIVSEARKPRFATEGQVAFAERLGVDVTSETPRGVAKKLIDKEVKRRGRKELKSDEWHIYDTVVHPKYGECEISAIHEKIVKITLAPLDGSRKVVVHAMNLSDYKRPGENIT